MARRFFALTRAERRLILQAGCAVVATRLALFLFSFRHVAGAIRRNPHAGGAPVVPAERIAWAVRAVAGRVPHASCLTQALSCHWLLGRFGYPATVRIGVARNAGRFESHAWVECDGDVILGEAHSPQRFKSIFEMRTERS